MAQRREDVARLRLEGSWQSTVMWSSSRCRLRLHSYYYSHRCCRVQSRLFVDAGWVGYLARLDLLCFQKALPNLVGVERVVVEKGHLTRHW